MTTPDTNDPENSSRASGRPEGVGGGASSVMEPAVGPAGCADDWMKNAGEVIADSPWTLLGVGFAVGVLVGFLIARD